MEESNEQLVHEVNPWRRLLKWVALLIITLCLLLLSIIWLLRWFNPPVTAFVLQEEWTEFEMERYNLRDSWVGLEELPEHLRWAMVASEDQRFWDHWGLDLEAIEEALSERQEGTRERGASTISQQVAKNLFLFPDESFIRKGVEAGITIFIELFWPKERILEVYLNIAEFGPGVFGVGKAAETFFGIHASQLVPEQSARLAAVLPSPKRMRVEPPSPYTQERSRWILRQMTQLSGIRYLPEAVPEEDPEPELPELREWEDEVPALELPDSTGRVDEPEFPNTEERVIEPDTGASDSLSERDAPLP